MKRQIATASTRRPPLPIRPLPATLAVILLLIAQLSAAQDEREPGWYGTAEFSFVGTDGNSEASTFGFSNRLERLWENAELVFTASALRAESTSFSRVAVGTVDDFRIQESSSSELTAENYGLGLRYDRDISARVFWFTGVQWTRNEFAGFDSRVVAVGGVGNLWWENDRGFFKTNYGLTYTTQDDLVPNPRIEDSFLGAQFGWSYAREFGNAKYTNVLVLDANIDETDDLRGDMVNAVSVNMTDRLAIKVSLHWLWDNLPAMANVTLVDENGEPTGDTVMRELESLDQELTVALVIAF